jgi:hypothetical protein
MNDINNIVQAEGKKIQDLSLPQKEKNRIIIRKGISGGLIAGALMGLYLFIMELSLTDPSSMVKFGKYLFLAAVLGYFLTKARRRNKDRYFFKRGALLGITISFISALTIILINGMAFFSGSEATFDKFTMHASSFGQFLLIDGVILFEIVVYGMILTFIWLQYLKGRTEYAQ